MNEPSKEAFEIDLDAVATLKAFLSVADGVMLAERTRWAETRLRECQEEAERRTGWAEEHYKRGVDAGARAMRSRNTLTRIQCEHAAWEARNFPNNTVEASFKGMIEEAGELAEADPSGAFALLMKALGQIAHADLKRSQNIRANEDHDVAAKDAIGDLVIFLMGYCTKRGWDLEGILIETWDAVRMRDWVKYPETGVDVIMEPLSEEAKATLMPLLAKGVTGKIIEFIDEDVARFEGGLDAGGLTEEEYDALDAQPGLPKPDGRRMDIFNHGEDG